MGEEVVLDFRGRDTGDQSDRGRARERGRVRTGGELRLGAPAGGSRPHDEGHGGDAGSCAHGVPAEAPGGAPFLPRGEHCGLLAKASDYAIGDPRAHVSPERIADQVIGVPCAAQFRVRSEPSEVRVKTVALELSVDQRR
jgi:hypothetical protein